MKKYGKLLIFVVAVLLVLILNHRYGWSEYLSDTENLAFLTQMARDNLFEAALIYIVITMVGCVALALPGVTFAVFAGLLFGPWLGTVFCIVATTLGAAIAFIVGRFFLKDSIKPMIEKNAMMKKLLFEGNEKNFIFVLMITRLVPLFPYNLQNFAYGITDISFFTYTLYTLIFMTPGVALFTIGSAGLTAGSNKWLYFAIAGVLLVVVMAIGWILKKKYLDEPNNK